MRRLTGLVLLAALLAGCGLQSATAPSVRARDHGPLTVRVVLDRTRVPAGEPLQGYALLTNTTPRRLGIQGCRGEWLAVGLASPSIPFRPAFADDACFGTTWLAPGPHRVPIDGYTTYTGCGGGAAADEPPCPRFGFPLLPLGTYDVTVVTTGMPKGTTVVPTRRVTLVNAQTGAAAGPESASIDVTATGCRWTGTRASMRVPVAVTVSLGGTVIGRAAGLGLGDFTFPAIAGRRYVIRTSAHRGGAVHTTGGVQSYINLFSHCS